jgi:hypothetical protein
MQPRFTLWIPVLFIAVSLLIATVSFVVDAQGTQQTTPSYVTVAGNGPQYYFVQIYSLNGTLIASQYSSYNQLAFSLLPNTYIVTAQTYVPYSSRNSYPEPWWGEWSTQYAYSVVKAPFNINVAPKNLSEYGCQQLTVNAKFVNGSLVSPSYVYAQPLGYQSYWYADCSSQPVTQPNNVVTVPNVPVQVVADYYYPVNLSGGALNETVDAGGMPVNITVNYWPESINLQGQALLLPPLPSSATLTLNESLNPMILPLYSGGVATTVAPAVSAYPYGQQTLTAPGPRVNQPPGVPSFSTNPLIQTQRVTIYKPVQATSGLLTTSSFELLATSVAGAAAVALVGYLVARRVSIA